VTGDRLPLVGLTEIAQRAGVQKPVVSMWRTRHKDFPEVVSNLHAGPVWLWPEVEKWLRESGRRTDAGWTLEQVNPSRGQRPLPNQEAPQWN
jgi:hypothetical protein